MGAATAAGFAVLAFESTSTSCHSCGGGGYDGGTRFAHPCKQLFKLLFLLRLQGLDLTAMPVTSKAMLVNKIREQRNQKKDVKVCGLHIFCFFLQIPPLPELSDLLLKSFILWFRVITA